MKKKNIIYTIYYYTLLLLYDSSYVSKMQGKSLLASKKGGMVPKNDI